jgi:para-nitrobenzyl esterase
VTDIETPIGEDTATTVEVDARDGRVRGRWRDIPGSRVRSAAFLGIPFARAPIGDLRFAAPVPPEPWEGVRDALEYAATPQRKPLADMTLIPEPSVAGDATLNVNVFTPRPAEPEAALPVMVWIHGGGFTGGSPASPWYDGIAFNRDGVVTVTVSYRLGFDGFGHIAGAPSNRGVRDWMLALEWVRDNIAAFGGDPGRVTIAGQSAGGGAVLTLLGMPAAQHLFHAVWALSGAVANVGTERAATLSAKVAHLAGVPATRDGFASVSEIVLTDLQDEAISSGSGDPLGGIRTLIAEGLSWGPVVDGDLLPQPTLDAIRAGVGADKPLVLGATDDEFTMATDSAKNKLRWIPAGFALGRLGLTGAKRRAYLGANRPQRAKGTAAVLGRFVTDAVFRAPVVRIAEARGDAPTWAYRFVWVSPSIGWACHCLDVPFWWDCLGSPVGIPHLAGEHPPQPLADTLHGAATSFVRDGRPGWADWSSRPGSTRLFGGGPSARDVVPDGYASVAALV